MFTRQIFQSFSLILSSRCLCSSLSLSMSFFLSVSLQSSLCQFRSFFLSVYLCKYLLILTHYTHLFAFSFSAQIFDLSALLLFVRVVTLLWCICHFCSSICSVCRPLSLSRSLSRPFSLTLSLFLTAANVKKVKQRKIKLWSKIV
jgi:hypothetical protein